MAVTRETELYPPLKHFFVRRGYEVKAEVGGCDLLAVRAGEPDPVIVEMKKIFTLPLLLQGIDRQKTGASVWLAVERNRSKKGAHNQRYRELTELCRRLRLGLLTVTFYKTKEPVIDVWCEPVPARPPAAASASLAAAEAGAQYGSGVKSSPRRSRRAAKLLQEFEARSGDYNVGGSSKSKLMTAYRERALQCALALRCHGPSAPRHIRDWTGVAKAALLLRDNHYGWFDRVQKGVYRITPAGEDALSEYAGVAAAWKRQFPWAEEWFAQLEAVSTREENLDDAVRHS